MNLIDIGINLSHRRFDHDRNELLARARAAGVVQMVVTGTNLQSSRAALDLVRTHPDILTSTAGCHPHDARNATPEVLAELAALARMPEVRAVGECGLDFDRDFSPRLQQEHVFTAQLSLAASVEKPVFLHERAAHARFLALLAPHRPTLKAAVVHCFTGTSDELDAYLAMDLHIGITGWICDERRGIELRTLVRRVPANRLMIETDAPFLTPRDAVPAPRGGRNEPALLPYVLRAVAKAVGRSESQVAQETTSTARAFFAL